MILAIVATALLKENPAATQTDIKAVRCVIDFSTVDITDRLQNNLRPTASQ